MQRDCFELGLFIVCNVINCLAPGACDVQPTARENCGFPGITEIECNANQCCYNSDAPDSPWCFKPVLAEGKYLCERY
uniref:P-type domain-containing protein n=1 Tax=Pelusios castaneus TaxID=367368 RepID=A0A8C8SML7_9SAUR